MLIIGSHWSAGTTYLYIKCECGGIIYHEIRKRTAVCAMCKGKQPVDTMPVANLEEKEQKHEVQEEI